MLLTFSTVTSVHAEKAEISKSTFNGTWPFTVESGVLECKNKYFAIFTSGGVSYGLNGAATSHGYKPIDPIWAPNPDIPGLKANVGPIINQALSLCQ